MLPSANAPGNRSASYATKSTQGAGRKPKGAVTGNRAVITTAEKKIGLYLHWNGERDTVEPLLRYCELKDYRAPNADNYGWARLCQVIGNFFGGTLNVGIMPYSDDKHVNPGDNGVYVIEGWRVADRILPYEGFVEQGPRDFDGRWEHYPMVAHSEKGTPIVARYDHNGDWGWNPNNRIESDTADNRRNSTPTLPLRRIPNVSVIDANTPIVALASIRSHPFLGRLKPRVATRAASSLRLETNQRI